MKLYNFAWGPYPRRAALYLAEKAASGIERVDVEFPHQPELWPPGFLRSLSPAASLPVLDTGTGVMIGQSIAIIEYLEEVLPGPSLLGDTPERRAATRSLVGVLDEATTFFGIWARQGSRLNAAAHGASVLNAERHAASREAAAVGAERFGSKLGIVENMLDDGPFLIGSSVTIADSIAMALLEFVQDFYGIPIPARCPKLARWYERFSSRPHLPACVYPDDLRQLAYGLPAQSGLSV